MNINEDINAVLNNIDPKNPAFKKALGMGLAHVGNGKFMDKYGQISHVIFNNTLVPYKKAVRSNDLANRDEVGEYLNFMQPQIDQVHGALSAHYTPDKYTNEELNSINHFTNLGYSNINNKLSKFPANIQNNKIQPDNPQDDTPGHITNLDSALRKSRAPFDFSMYTKLGPDVDLNNFQPGQEFRFKGFRSASIYPGHLINTENSRTDELGRPQIAMLHIKAAKNSRVLYAHDYSANPLGDTILPRGAKLKIVDGPKQFIGNNATDGNLDNIVQIDCEHKS